MNELTKHLLEAILTEKQAWKWKGRGKARAPTEPNLEWIKNEYALGWEAVWVEQIWLPKIARAYELLKIIKSGHPDYIDLPYVKSHWQDVLVDGDEKEYLQCDRCAEALQYQLTDPRWKGIGILCLFEWIEKYHLDMEYEDLTLEMIEEFQSEPTFTHQKSLL